MVKKAKQKENAKRKKAAAKSPVVRAAVVNKPSKKSGNFDKVYKSPKKSGWQKFVDYLKKRPVLMFLIVFLVLGAGFVAYNQYRIYQEKQDFEQVEIVLDELANSIADELGKPLKTEKEKSCSYRSEKYNSKPGRPTCRIANNLYYPNTWDELDAAFNIISSNEAINPGQKSQYYGSRSYGFYIKGSALECNIGLSREYYPLDSELLYLSCYTKSSKEHFPVE